MVKIEDAVDGVLNAMRSRGHVEHSLKEIKWSILNGNLLKKELWKSINAFPIYKQGTL